MRIVLSLVLLLLTAPALLAETGTPAGSDEPSVQPSVVVVDEAAPAPAAEPVLAKQRVVKERPAANAAQDMPQRGSFWWIVGAIVVAGVILALLLD